MDQRILTQEQPIIVDLDGTLLRGDLFWDSLFLSLRRNPMTVIKLFGWLAGGIAKLKAQLAETANLDPSNLPYREELLRELRTLKNQGRRLVLATGANEKLAHAVADHLNLFDEVIASDSETNLTGARKLERIKSELGDRAFEYYGNSRKDLCLFEAANSATVVAPDLAAHRWQKRNGARRIDSTHSTLISALRAMRPQQWLKNTLIFVPAILAHQILEAPVLISTFLAFMSFCFAASSIYIVNDLLDLDADRRHATKRRRPLASGNLNHPAALVTAGVSLILSLTIAAFLPLGFLVILLGYIVATTAYSVAVKRMLLLDILVLAGLYAARVQAGAAAAQIEYSFWLVAFSAFFFLSLALVKRFNELQQVGITASRATTGRGYRFEDSAPIAQAGMASGFASVLVLALYIDSPEIEQAYSSPHLVWLLCPIVLYLVMRVWILAGRGHMNEDPVVFILNDWRSQLMIGFGCVLFLLAIVF